MVRVKVLNGKGRVESIFLQGRNLPWLDLKRCWTVEALLDALKYFPGNEFAFWNREWKVRGIWRPIAQLKAQLFPPKPPAGANQPVNKSGQKCPQSQSLEIYFLGFESNISLAGVKK